MRITFSGEEKVIEENTVLSQLIPKEYEKIPKYIALNDEFIKEEEINTKTLKDGDNIELFFFMGGGQ